MDRKGSLPQQAVGHQEKTPDAGFFNTSKGQGITEFGRAAVRPYAKDESAAMDRYPQNWGFSIRPGGRDPVRDLSGFLLSRQNWRSQE
jgi:hypothetical protein